MEEFKSKLIKEPFKTLSTFFTLFGLLNLVIYYTYIEYVPSIKIEDLGVLFITTTASSLFLLVNLSMYLIIPGLILSIKRKSFYDVYFLGKEIKPFFVAAICILTPFLTFSISSALYLILNNDPEKIPPEYILTLTLALSWLFSLAVLKILDFKFVHEKYGKFKISLQATAASFLIFFPVIVVLAIFKTSNEFKGNYEDYIYIFITGLSVLLINIIISSSEASLLKILISGFMLILIISISSKNTYYIPKATAKIFKIGNFKVDSIHFSDDGCKVLEEMNEKCIENTITDVIVLSRLGHEYLIETPDNRKIVIKKSYINGFTLPKEY
ncbi:hypothetical protein [Marinomonas ostreistagni]|uniref:hypothetical protein n=1 Tax=Marinomonas ostreistagni TaxID=359209 RepID=UPI00195105E8|nr:hypothetical protein [Marinomonas ostreistagni]MBM6550761.1 hypothetical protein [Marinomonas ostreistagni]